MTINTTELLNTALEAAQKAGEKIKEIRATRDLSVRFKSARDLVTVADIESEKIIIETIKSRFPDHGFLAEESSPHLTDEKLLRGPLWIIDPVDGTTNFAHGHHHVGISIAFADKGTLLCGVVHAPFVNETFSAIKGGGAFLNGAAIKASNAEELGTALIATGFPPQRDDLALIMRRLHDVLKNCRDVRRIGAASLDISWVACGRLDGFYETISTWDIAAGTLIAREAGAKVGHLHSLPKDLRLPEEFYANELLVTAPNLFSPLLELLK